MDEEQARKLAEAQQLARIGEPLSEERKAAIKHDLEFHGGAFIEEGAHSLESIIVGTLARLPFEIYKNTMQSGRHVWFTGPGTGD
jgi:hypothetical protein